MDTLKNQIMKEVNKRYSINKVTILKDLLEESIGDFIPEDNYSVTNINIIETALDIEYATFDNGLKVKHIVIDNNSVL